MSSKPMGLCLSPRPRAKVVALDLATITKDPNYWSLAPVPAPSDLTPRLPQVISQRFRLDNKEKVLKITGVCTGTVLV